MADAKYLHDYLRAIAIKQEIQCREEKQNHSDC